MHATQLLGAEEIKNLANFHYKSIIKAAQMMRTFKCVVVNATLQGSLMHSLCACTSIKRNTNVETNLKVTHAQTTPHCIQHDHILDSKHQNAAKNQPQSAYLWFGSLVNGNGREKEKIY